jgi:site-specific DNA-methyltransferase (adenine-specific)
MAHLSENGKRLIVKEIVSTDHRALIEQTRDFNDVCILRLPSCPPNEYSQRLEGIGQLVADVAARLGSEAVLITLGEVIDLVAVHPAIGSTARYQSWIAIKRTPQSSNGSTSLPRHHFGALIHSRYDGTLRHTKTRIGYTFCPACDKTTKDYGGKKHTYHEYGTLMSDVWRDVTCELDGDLVEVTDRFADLFGIEQYSELRIIDCRALPLKRLPVVPTAPTLKSTAVTSLPGIWTNKLAKGDCLKQVKKIPDNSVDFVFADPPYNLGKNYTGYTDDLAITEYFNWCDQWLGELARVLKPGSTCAILNIPLYAIRHFLYMETILDFQNWIAWDALSFPVRLLMPAHYSILLFSKGAPRPLPELTSAGHLESNVSLTPLGEGYCLRSHCVNKRTNDRGTLTDLWWDIHRLKHNTRRVDHPCQLPPQLMYRLISLYTKPGETVLDCFNGAGTTTLTAHQLDRNYIGIEKEETYHELTQSRHEEIRQGLDPFRKAVRQLTAKNSPVPRMLKQKYAIPKKTLQLEVRRVAKKLGRLPDHHELARYSKYPIEYYDQYFASWGEVCAAARTTGMTEERVLNEDKHLSLLGVE